MMLAMYCMKQIKFIVTHTPLPLPVLSSHDTFSSLFQAPEAIAANYYRKGHYFGALVILARH